MVPKIIVGLMAFAVIIGCTKREKGVHLANGSPVDGVLITKAQYGTNWPFRLDSLYMFRGEKSDVYVEKMDTVYAVNSIASDIADSEEIDSFQQWNLIVKNYTTDQYKTKQEIELLGLKQWVNKLNRR
jgi:hypothetical protein